MSDGESSTRSPIDLSEQAGMDVILHPDLLTLTFGDAVRVPNAAEERLPRDLQSVLCDPEAAAHEENVLYRVYRDIAPFESHEEIARRGLTFVALVLRPGTVGVEFTRTRGHTNNKAHATSAVYPEVHGIWHGSALLYLQKRAAPESEDVCVIPLGAGDKALVAPGWASLIANIGTEPLVIGTWRTADCIPQHEALLALGGMAHFIIAPDADDSLPYRLEPNGRYTSVPAPRLLEPRDLMDFGLKRDTPLLTAFRRNPEYLRFMQRPQDYGSAWEGLYPSAAEPEA